MTQFVSPSVGRFYPTAVELLDNECNQPGNWQLSSLLACELCKRAKELGLVCNVGSVQCALSRLSDWNTTAFQDSLRQFRPVTSD